MKNMKNMKNKNTSSLLLPGMLREMQFRRCCSLTERENNNTDVTACKNKAGASGEARTPCSKAENKKPNKPPTLKIRFLTAVKNGELGTLGEQGYIVTLKAFRQYFSDITSQYVSSFLAEATIEAGRTAMTHRKFVFRLRKGVYLVHPDAFARQEF